MKNNYILVDFENVQPRGLEMLKEQAFRIIVFVGANQKKVPFELAASLQALGRNAEYIQIEGNGPNALDFHIAFYIGRLAEQDQDAYFHIISRDTGFDPLIRHLQNRKIMVQRHKDVADIPLLRNTNLSSIEEMVSAVAENLAMRAQSRPRKVKTLANTINALFQKKLDEAELAEIIALMKKRKMIRVDNDKVSYRPPISQG